MKQFLTELADLLEKHDMELHPGSDQDGCDQDIQFWPNKSDNPWCESVTIDSYTTPESIREYIKKEKMK